MLRAFSTLTAHSRHSRTHCCLSMSQLLWQCDSQQSHRSTSHKLATNGRRVHLFNCHFLGHLNLLFLPTVIQSLQVTYLISCFHDTITDASRQAQPLTHKDIFAAASRQKRKLDEREARESEKKHQRISGLMNPLVLFSLSSLSSLRVSLRATLYCCCSMCPHDDHAETEQANIKSNKTTSHSREQREETQRTVSNTIAAV